MFGPAAQTWFTESFAASTPVQQEGWPAIASGRNALLLAPTGSGKTLAAFLWAIDSLSRRGREPDEEPATRVLYISPLKALIYDIEKNLRAPLVGIERAAARLGEPFRALQVDVRTGDTSQQLRRHQARTPGDVLITTPESLYLLLGSKARDNLRGVETVIVDEIHSLAPTKRGAHLALSLERLEALCVEAGNAPFQRIGLSATARPPEQIARFLAGGRPVEVIDAGQHPDLDLQIVVPVADMAQPFAADAVTAEDGSPVLSPNLGIQPGDSTRDSIWPTIYPRLLDLIRQHHSTIIFVNARGLCERLSRRLNELAGEELTLAHHGSISHQRRTHIEELLKSGKLKGLVATGSLELGIDMGAVDLVILVESPGAVSTGLQRVGRAGHGVGQRSKGRLFPKFRGDLLESAVVSGMMRRGEIEPVRIPTNPLDVLCQQVVASCAMDDWAQDELFALVRRAWPYRELSGEVWAATLDMLDGAGARFGLADLQPRIAWDRSGDVLRGRKGARMVALLNAGTIPDRGQFGVFVAGAEGADGAPGGGRSGGGRVGELDEEMVYETRKGDVIVLGASTWRVQDITRDQVQVVPAPGEPGRLPFWRGDGPGRPIELGQAIGAFTRELLDRGPAGLEWLQEHAPLDDLAARNLVAYLAEQVEHTGAVPTDRAVVVERFRDELGDWRICILTPFGSRVHAPWAMALSASLGQGAGPAAQALWTDDGIVLRFADGDDLPETDALIPDPDEVEELVLEQLGQSALFASHFRQSAARALLLPRKSREERTPLWAQRLRSQTLLDAVRGVPGFPILLETYRECLQDVFDMPALKALLAEIRGRRVRVEDVQTPSASPFARSLVFAFVAAYLYEGDASLAERKATALTLDRALLRELLGQEALRDLLDPQVIEQLEAELQWLAEDRRAGDVDRQHDLLRRLGDLSHDEVLARSTGDWLEGLAAQKRACKVRIAGRDRWIAAEDLGRYRDALGVVVPPGMPATFLEPTPAAMEGLLRRWAATHGPFLTADVARRWSLVPDQVHAQLASLEARGLLTLGEIRPGGVQREWCDPDVLRRLRRRTLARLRGEVAPVEASVLARFLPEWHGIGSKRTRLEDVLTRLEGLALPWSSWLEHILPARVHGFTPQQLDQLGAQGRIVWIGRGALGARDGKVALVRRERASLLLEPVGVPEDLSPLEAELLLRLEQRGACFFSELCQGWRSGDVREALLDLAWAGLVTNDTFGPLLDLRSRRKTTGAGMAGGRWSLVRHLVHEPAGDTERAHAQALLLLERHGLVCQQSVGGEGVPGGFSALYPVFKLMEEQGRVRRGYFVDGLGGAQFCLPGAVDRLRAARDASPGAQILAAVDPAQPYGAVLPWPDSPGEGSPRRVPGAVVVTIDGEPVLYAEKGGKRLRTFAAFAEHGPVAIAAIRQLPGRRRFTTLRVDTIDGTDAGASSHGPLFMEAGFVRDRQGLLLVVN